MLYNREAMREYCLLLMGLEDYQSTASGLSVLQKDLELLCEALGVSVFVNGAALSVSGKVVGHKLSALEKKSVLARVMEIIDDK
ncbi:hypothetical protein [Candidatus Synchoanobacter obligatus]|uniref:Uncharacterized protein n=1 Tax=Candidatus Synchoanobacter obligatus TaxID=2919597 RepID=A0ABT1L681_9GAMM|nr:hypothetical protein [Candidatus Synchoanobacter obligatus]MCP8352446.1 hypothetical protein [Candidatus Synchoanobacter obligatus]